MQHFDWSKKMSCVNSRFPAKMIVIQIFTHITQTLFTFTWANDNIIFKGDHEVERNLYANISVIIVLQINQ